MPQPNWTVNGPDDSIQVSSDDKVPMLVRDFLNNPFSHMTEDAFEVLDDLQKHGSSYPHGFLPVRKCRTLLRDGSAAYPDSCRTRTWKTEGLRQSLFVLEEDRYYHRIV